MALEWPLDGGARVDCLSATHAIEVDFSDKWAEALSQAPHLKATPNRYLFAFRKAQMTVFARAHRDAHPAFSTP